MTELAPKIRAILDSLTNQDDTQAKDVFREIFCNVLGFSYASEEVELEYFRTSVSEIVKSVEVIAKTDPPDGTPFFIIYVSAKKMTKTLRQMLIRDLLNFTEAIDLAFANFISIIKTGDVWQIVAPLYRKETDKVVLRTYTIGPGEKHRTVAEALSKLKVEKPHPSALQIKDTVDEAMYIRPLTEEFFDDYKEYYGLIHDYVLENYGNVFAERYLGKLPTKIFTLRAAKSFAHSLLNRLMFIYFLQKKGWLGDRKDFVRWLWEVYEEDERQDKEFYRDYLRPLLLEAMNKPKNERRFNDLPDEVVRVFLSVPYFNGGLFSHVFEENVDVDEIVTSIPDEVLRAVIFEFLEEYNFTVTEESPYEVEIAVDPAMLGHIYESLIAEQERGVSGIFYTPRVEVDLMCRLAIFEYLLNFTDDRMKLLELVFKHPSEFEERVSREILNALENAKIVDPACGSGAFLIGAYYVIRELLEKAGIPVDFERKREIFRKNLYGVDIKEWAVRVAELRMWLALIEEEEELPGAEPVLPNLNVNLKVGDSLIPEVEVNGKRIVLPKSFLEKWKKHIRGNGYKEIADKVYDGIVDRAELERIKTEILKSVVKELHKEAFITQRTLTGEEVEVGNFTEHEKSLIKQLNETKDVKVPFIWEIDFPEVFANGGFDIVISNPPYVRQEMIYPEYLDLHEFEMLDSSIRERLKKEYKQLVINTTNDIAISILKQKFEFNKRSDLYVYFFVHSFNLLKKRGILVYITSNSWLDVNYGTKLQEFFLRAAELKYIIDNIRRTFEQADINTVITVLKRKWDEDVNVAKGNCTNFVMLKVPFENLTFNDVVEITTHYCDTLARKVTVFGGDVYLYENERVRVRSVKDVDLCVIGGVSREETAGVEEDEVMGLKIENYAGEKWRGLFLRAPPILYKIFARNRDKLVRLGDIAEVKFGIKTGANNFFYLKKLDGRPVCPVCGVVHEGDDLVPVENGAGWRGYIEKEFLRPVIKSSQQLNTLQISLGDSNLMVFLCNSNLDELQENGYTHALKYIRDAEEKLWSCSVNSKHPLFYSDEQIPCIKCGAETYNFYMRSTVSGKEWWRINLRKISDILCMAGFNDRFAFWINGVALCDKRLYDVYVENDEDRLLIAGLLNTTFIPLQIELFATSNLGEGALDFKVYEAEMLLVLRPEIVKDAHLDNRIVEIVENMANREIKSIFEELGLPEPNDDYSNINPDDIKLENIMPDRRELDRIIFEALGLTEEEQLEVYKAVVELVKQRLAKARTFKERKR